MFDVKPITSSKRTDCGPTCLKMLLDFYGIEVSLEQLTEECNARIIGCTGADLLRVGRAHGLDMRAYQMDAAELLRQDRPAIIWWQYNHFVVYAGQDDKGNAVICNPDRGRFGIDPGTFCARYAGVAIFNGDPEPIEEG